MIYFSYFSQKLGFDISCKLSPQKTIRMNLFVCVEVLRPSQPSGVMSSAVTLPNHTFTGQALSSKRLTSIVHILSPENNSHEISKPIFMGKIKQEGHHGPVTLT